MSTASSDVYNVTRKRKTSQIVPLSLQKKIGFLVHSKNSTDEETSNDVALSCRIRNRVISLEYVEAVADLSVLIAIVVQVFLVPLILAAQLSEDHDWYQSVRPAVLSCLFVLLVDQVRCAVAPIRTMETDKNLDANVLVKITDLKTIATSYLFSRRLVADCLSELLGLATLFANDQDYNSNRVLVILALLCVHRLPTIYVRRVLRNLLENDEQKASKHSEYRNVQRIMLSIAAFSILAHYLACGFFILGMNNHLRTAEFEQITEDGKVNEGWITNTGISGESFGVQYVDSMYWAVTTLVTVGYGDIVPYAYNEKVYSIFVLFLGAAAYAAVFGSVTTLFQNLDISRNRYNERMDQTSEFLKHAGLDKTLERKVVAYTNKLWSINKGFEFQAFIQEFPLHLQTEVTMARLAGLVRKVPMFQEVSENFLKELVMCLKQSVCLRHDYIFKKGDIAQSMYFLRKGQLCIVLDDRQVVAILSPGSCFGEIGVVAKACRTASVMADVDCEFYTLHQLDLESILDKFPEYRTEVMKMAERRLLRDVKREAEEDTHSFKIAGVPLVSQNSITGSKANRSKGSTELLHSLKSGKGSSVASGKASSLASGKSKQAANNGLKLSIRAEGETNSGLLKKLSKSMSKRSLRRADSQHSERKGSRSFRRRTSMDVLVDLMGSNSHNNHDDTPQQLNSLPQPPFPSRSRDEESAYTYENNDTTQSDFEPSGIGGNTGTNQFTMVTLEHNGTSYAPVQPRSPKFSSSSKQDANEVSPSRDLLNQLQKQGSQGSRN